MVYTFHAASMLLLASMVLIAPSAFAIHDWSDAPAGNFGALDELDAYGLTQLMTASEDGNTELVAALLRAGANVNLLTKWGGRTALHGAAHNGHIAIAGMLIAAGADVSITDFHRFTPLHDAVVSGHADMCLLLVVAKSDVNALSAGQMTHLHFAVQLVDLQIVRILVNAGAVVDLQTVERETPLDVARRIQSRGGAWRVVNDASTQKEQLTQIIALLEGVQPVRENQDLLC